MRELTDKELRKLKEFRDLITEEIYEQKKTLWGRFNAMMADVEYRRELVCDSVEIFLTHDIKELRKEFNSRERLK